MRKLRYAVAMSLDGYIAGPNGEYDWIDADPEVDFTRFGRSLTRCSWADEPSNLPSEHVVRTLSPRLPESLPSFSRGLSNRKSTRNVTVLPELNADWVRDLKAQSGKDIWLFGGGSLFRSFFDAGLVDGVEVAVVPVLLGAGIP